MNNALKFAWRNLYRDKTYALINIVGLAIAAACCLILFLYLRLEFSYDRHFDKHERIYRIVNEFSTSGTPNNFAATSSALAPMLKADYPSDIEDYVRFSSIGTSFMVRYEDRTFYWDRIYATDDNVFNVFNHRITQGDADTALLEANTVAISESFARQYFGDRNPIGELLFVEDGTSLKVTLVFADLPQNSHLQYDALISRNHPRYALPNPEQVLFRIDSYSYLLLPEGSDFTERYAELSHAFFLKHMEERGKTANQTWRSWLQPLPKIHLYSKVNYDEPTGNAFFLYGLAATGALILLVACINYINLATARAGRRVKAVGMRKILGSGRSALILGFLGESIFYCLMALIIGAVLTEVVLALAPVEQLTGKRLALDLFSQPGLLGALVAISLGVGLIAGLYPALYLSSWAPLSTLVGKYQPGKGSLRLRQLLVFIQLASAITVIACTLMMATQMQFIASKPLGFAKQNRIHIRLQGVDLIEQVPVIAKELSTHASVLGVTTTDTLMGLSFRSNPVDFENNEGVYESVQFNNTRVDEHFIDVMGMRLVAGQNFSAANQTQGNTGFVVNETLARKMGWQEPIGKKVRFFNASGKVIGVVEDFNFRSLHSSVEPFAFYNFQDDFSTLDPGRRPWVWRMMIINIAGDDMENTLRFIERTFRTFDAVHPFDFQFLEDSLNGLYQSERKTQQLIGIFAAICIFIACLGLFGMAVFTTEQRTKEIGIRKTLGASTGQIVLLLARNLVVLVAAGALLASAIAYLAIDTWLSGFAYRAPINPLVFLIATLITALVAYITIALQSYRTASADPVRSLRYE